MQPLGVYIYAFGSQSCATQLGLEGSAPLAAAKRTAHGTSGARRVSGRPRPLSRSPRRRSLRLRDVSRCDALSAGYRLLASRRATPRIRRTASPRIAQLGTRPPCVVSSPLMRCVPFAPFARLRLWLRRLVFGVSEGAESAASEEGGFAGVRGAVYAASGISRGMAGCVRHIVLGKKRKTA